MVDNESLAKALGLGWLAAAASMVLGSARMITAGRDRHPAPRIRPSEAYKVKRPAPKLDKWQLAEVRRQKKASKNRAANKRARAARKQQR